MARTIAFWTLAILIFYGCSSLRSELASRFPSMGKPVGGLVIPVLSLELTPAFLIAATLFAAGMFFVQRWCAKPKNADLLIDTELELRKVTWPSYQEVVNSSLVVVFCVLFLMGFLAGADWFLARLARRLLLGEG